MVLRLPDFLELVSLAFQACFCHTQGLSSVSRMESPIGVRLKGKIFWRAHNPLSNSLEQPGAGSGDCLSNSNTVAPPPST